VLLDPQGDEQLAVMDAWLTRMHRKAVSRIVGPAKATMAFENSVAPAAHVLTGVNRSAAANLQLALAGRSSGARAGGDARAHGDSKISVLTGYLAKPLSKVTSVASLTAAYAAK
jgi:hypothetical protein